MIILSSESLSGVASSSSSISTTTNQAEDLNSLLEEAMPALTVHKSSSEVRGGVSSSGTSMPSMAAVEPFVVRLGVGPRWWS